MKKVIETFRRLFPLASVSALLFFAALPLSAFERIISPAAGTWANKQPLVLDTSDGAECFYSYSGSDPLTSGFAYDSPVLIDAAGSVTVRIVSMIGDRREESEVTYTVSVPEKLPFESSSPEYTFISSVSSNPVCDVPSSSPFIIPSSLSYRMENDGGDFTAGASLSLDPSDKLARYIPCTVTDGKSQWRFIIRTGGSEIGTLAKQDVPFELKDWSTFTWTGKKMIWTIDDGEWSAKKDPVQIDRTVSHTVSWQSVAYETGNPVHTFVLPPVPSLQVKTDGTGNKPVSFIISGDARYRMELVSSGSGGDVPGSNGLFTEALFDTFAGDTVSGKAVFAVYCDGVYQGNLIGDYCIDRKAPSAPKIISSSEGFYARHSVDVKITAEKDTSVFYAVSAPLYVSDSDAASLAPDAPALKNVTAGDFRPYGSSSVVLPSGANKAVYYKVCAYAQDKAGNTSAVSEYAVVIDEYNYWLSGEKAAEPSSESTSDTGESSSPDSAAETVFQDGSRLHPFTTFAQALGVINSGRFARFYVSGTVNLPGGDTAISSNCAFVGEAGTRFVIPSDGTIVLTGASLEASNCTFEKQKSLPGETQNSSFFKLDNAVASFANVEIVGIFGANGTVFSADKSVITISDSGMTAQADTYACCVSCIDSKVTAKKSRIVSIAPTAVNFSINGGLFEVRNTNCKVIARIGRIAELVKTNARLTDNTYAAELEKKSSSVTAVWKDDGTLTLEDSGNVATGF